MAFTNKQVKVLSPFLWHYPAHSPWRALTRVVGVVSMVAMIAVCAPHLPGVGRTALDVQHAAVVLEQMERNNITGRPLKDDTQVSRPGNVASPVTNIAGMVALPDRSVIETAGQH